MSRQRSQSKVVMQNLVRPLLGIIVTAIYFDWARAKDLQELLFPSLYLTGLITSIVAGLPLGWMLTASYILIKNRFGSLLLDAVLNGQGEPPIFVGMFAVVASAGGLSGWGITILIQSLLRLILRK